MQGGRARWKSETATCNTLTNQGDHFAHTSGHGEQQLSVVVAMLMRLAVLVDQTQPLCCVWCQGCGQSWAATACSGSGCEPCCMTMPLRPCASCSQRSGTASRRSAPSLRWIPLPRPPCPLERRAIEPDELPALGDATPQGRDGSAFHTTAWHVASRTPQQKTEMDGRNTHLRCSLPWSYRMHKS
jgi:hypothetical protein